MECFDYLHTLIIEQLIIKSIAINLKIYCIIYTTFNHKKTDRNNRCFYLFYNTFAMILSNYISFSLATIANARFVIAGVSTGVLSTYWIAGLEITTLVP